MFLDLLHFLTYNEKYNTVLVVLGLIWLGIILHLFYLEKRLQRLEREVKEKTN